MLGSSFAEIKEGSFPGLRLGCVEGHTESEFTLTKLSQAQLSRPREHLLSKALTLTSAGKTKNAHKKKSFDCQGGTEDRGHSRRHRQCVELSAPLKETGVRISDCGASTVFQCRLVPGSVVLSLSFHIFS